MRTILLALALTACGPAPQSPLELPKFQVPDPPVATERPALLDYTTRALAVCARPLSPTVRAALAEDIVAVAAHIFPLESDAQAYVALLCIESGFDQAARSPAGAVGIAQVMPAYAADFAAECGLPRATAADLQVQAVNLRLGACHFRHLLTETAGNVPLALAAYNAGAASKTAAKLKAGATGAAETSGYLARHYVLTEQLRSNE